METKGEYIVEGTGGKVDLSYLARLMLEWEVKRRHLDELEEAIKDTVLQLGKTQTAGNVRATFSNPRKTYDYATPGMAAPASVIKNNTTEVVDWRQVCKDADIAPLVFEGNGPGSVTLKLLS